jgi:hypothetical protein
VARIPSHSSRLFDHAAYMRRVVGKSPTQPPFWRDHPCRAEQPTRQPGRVTAPPAAFRHGSVDQTSDAIETSRTPRARNVSSARAINSRHRGRAVLREGAEFDLGETKATNYPQGTVRDPVGNRRTRGQRAGLTLPANRTALRRSPNGIRRAGGRIAITPDGGITTPVRVVETSMWCQSSCYRGR